jgi:hypothetical protein
MLKRHPRISEMESDQQNGMPLKDIAIKYNVSRHALGRHFRKPTKTETLESQIEKWKLRGDRLWTIAADSSDARGMALAVQSGLRSLEMQLKRQQEIAELTAPAVPPGELTLDAFDQAVAAMEIRDHTAALERVKGLRDHYAQPDPSETPEQRVQSSRKALHYHFEYELIERFESEPELRTAVLQFADDFAQQKRENKLDVIIQERPVTSNAN